MKMHVKKFHCEDMKWMELARGIFQWWGDLFSAVFNLRMVLAES